MAGTGKSGLAEVSGKNRNPFRPGFGRFPPELAGRHEYVRTFAEALREQRTAAFLVRGHRGMGKTVLLSAFEDAAREEGWMVLATTAKPGFVDELTRSDIPALLREVVGDKNDRALSGITVPGVGGITTTARRRYDPEPTLYLRVMELLEAQSRQAGAGSGILITVDEIEVNVLADVTDIATTMQRLLREDAPVAFVFAGLPHNIERLLHSPHTTFLRRAKRLDIGRLSWDAAKLALAHPLYEYGRRISPEALTKAVEATRGYPFLTQVVGSQLWSHAKADGQIPDSAIADVAAAALQVMAESVHEPALLELSPSQRKFLAALAISEGPARTGELADLLGVSSQRISALTRELSAAGLVLSPARGQITIAAPYLGEYIRRHGVEPRPAPLDDDSDWGPETRS